MTNPDPSPSMGLRTPEGSRGVLWRCLPLVYTNRMVAQTSILLSAGGIKHREK